MTQLKEEKSGYRAFVPLFVIASVVVVLDQAAKAAVVAYLPIGKAISVIPGFFDLVSVRNRGAAFGILNRDDMEWQFWLFMAATIIAIGAILSLARQSAKQPLMLTALGLILGGAIGNLIDRIRFRAVVDFLDFYWGSWHWPAFNVADAAICVGVFLACASTLLKKKENGS